MDPLESTFPSSLRPLTYFNELALAVGLQIGSGIFSTPSAVSNHVPSHIEGILIWILTGLLVWTGASSFIELGVTCPIHGGIQEYLRYYFGDIYGFLFAWIWIFVVKPCAMAMIALIFAEYLYKPFDAETSIWTLKGTALLAILSVTYLNCMGTQAGAGTANVFLVLKTGGLVSIAISGLLAAAGVFKNTSRPELNKELRNSEHEVSSFLSFMKDTVEATFAALFAYGGWESVRWHRFLIVKSLELKSVRLAL